MMTSNGHRISGLGFWIVWALWSVTVSAPASAAELTVTGGCTLIDAITAANTDAATGACPAGDPGLDTIHLTSDVVLDAIADDGVVFFSDLGPAGLPRIVTPIAIDGHGHAISRSPAAPDFRLLMVFSGFFGAGELSARDLTLRGGRAILPAPDFLAPADDGGALLNLGGPVRLERVAILGNVATAHGGGVANYGPGVVEIEDCELGSLAEPNVAYLGGAIANLLGGAPVVRIFGSRARGNRAILGGAFSNQGVADVVDSLFENNDAERGGAISNMSGFGDLRVINVLFQNNIGGSGGALHNFNAADVVVRNSAFLANVADGPLVLPGFGNFGGGAIDSGGSGASVQLVDSALDQNRVTFALGSGGGLALDGPATITNSVLTDNDTSGGRGGAIDTDFGGLLEVINSRIEGSNGSNGGAIHTAETPVLVLASRLADNFASNSGGAIMGRTFFALDPARSIVVRDSIFESNEADVGGGIYVDRRRVEITGSTFTGNRGTQIGLPGGGALYAQIAEVEIVDSTFSGNFGGTASGAIHINQATPTAISGSTIVGNTAFRRGGLSTFDSPVELSDTLIAGNTATSGDGTDDCLDLSGQIVDLGGNIDGNGTCNVATTIDFPSLLVGPLADNGGATPTHALLDGSPAIDFTGGPCPESGNVDQRGAARDALCDTGAFEAGLELPVLSFAEDGSTVFEGIDGGGTVDLVLDNHGGLTAGDDVTVFVTLNGTAAFGFDYQPTTAIPLVIPVPAPGASTAVSIDYDLFDDARQEGDETIVLTLAFTGPAVLGANSRHVVTILDDEIAGYCGELQRAVQQSVGDEDGRYRNHGQYVSTVNKNIKRLSRLGFVTEGCRGCIVSQFARRIPIAEQLPCGDPGG